MRAGEIRRWKPSYVEQDWKLGQFFILLAVEGSSRTDLLGNPLLLAHPIWTILCSTGELSAGWGETSLRELSEHVSPVCDAQTGV